MSYVERNPNPKNARVGDCVVRAIAIATDRPWEEVYSKLAAYGYMMSDMPSSNAVWGKYLKDLGYERGSIEDTCPEECYTVRDFVEGHRTGTYILGTGSHAVAVVDGDYYDAWDSGDEIPIYFWRI